jgi:hypothetical protein
LLPAAPPIISSISLWEPPVVHGKQSVGAADYPCPAEAAISRSERVYNVFRGQKMTDRRSSIALAGLALASYATLAFLSHGSVWEIIGLIAGSSLVVIWLVVSLVDSAGRKTVENEDPAPTSDGMVVVHVAGDLAEAGLLCSALQCRNIDAEIRNEFIQQSIGGLPPSMPTYPRIVVRAYQAEEAAGLVRELLDRRKAGVAVDLEDGEEDGEDDEMEPEAAGDAQEYENVSILDLLGSLVYPLFSKYVIGFLLLAAAVTVFVVVISHYLYHGNQPPLFGGRGGHRISSSW